MGTYSSNILPNATGLNLGSDTQRWDLFGKDVNADSVTSTTANPAISGTINLASTDDIAWRSAVSNSDVVLSKSQGAGALPADTLQWPTGFSAAEIITSTVNPSATGTIRLAKSDYLKFRNNANSADIVGLSLNGDDTVNIGGGGGAKGASLAVTGALSGGSVTSTGGSFLTPSGTPAILQVQGSSGGGASILAAGGATGGAIAVTAGAGSAGNGGSVTITGGNSATSATGGDIVLVPGTGASSQGRCLLNGSTSIANRITSYDGFTTGGEGVPVMVAAITSSAQTAAIGTTTLYTSTRAGLYRLNYSLTIDVIGNGVNLTGTWGWQDAAVHTLTTANILCSTLGANSTTALGLGNITFAHSSGFNITYATALSGGIGAGSYTLRLILEFLG